MTFFQNLKGKLSRTKEGFVGKLSNLISLNKKIDEDFYEELEEILVTSDVGVTTSLELVEKIRGEVKRRKIKESSELIGVLKEEMGNLLSDDTDIDLSFSPTVIMVVGVNGSGKTTTIGKLAYKLRQEGKDVLLVAGDTFRAAAIEQLDIWANDTGSDIIKYNQGADPAAVTYDAIQAARSRGKDVVIIDTAGRLQTNINLMKELEKVKRVIQKDIPEAPHETLLVVDATTGQNAISQAKLFNESVQLTGIVLTKLDGTAKGGVIFGIGSELNIPVKYIGVGEKVDDLRPFNPDEFVNALFEEE